MKFCRTCRHLTAGKPAFCPSCGGSYDVKLCPRLHINARSTSVCSTCGSRELSKAQPPLSALLLIAFFALRAIGPIALLIVTVAYFVEFVGVAIREPDQLLGQMLFGLGLGCLWLLVAASRDHGSH
jgi:RNA polymerase subunit RPABC4/transcription elongation factor Spt4